jgi:PPOX class probable F420-dependent enzyme
MAQPGDSDGNVELPEPGRTLLADGLRFATLATINPDGSPHEAVVWYLLEDETLVINGKEGRTWTSNLRRDPRISLSVEDGYRWVSVRGTVDIVDETSAAQADAAAAARHYHADEPERAEDLIHRQFELERRVSFRLSLDSSKLYYHED